MTIHQTLVVNSSHSQLCRALDLRLEFEDLVSSVTLPKNRRELTLDNAVWILDNGHAFNHNNAKWSKVHDICINYVDIYNSRKR